MLLKIMILVLKTTMMAVEVSKDGEALYLNNASGDQRRTATCLLSELDSHQSIINIKTLDQENLKSSSRTRGTNKVYREQLTQQTNNQCRTLLSTIK